MIETTLLATSEKLWPSARRIFGAPCSSSAKEVAKKFSIPARPLSVRRSPRAASLSQHVARLVKRRARLGDAEFVAGMCA